MIKKYVKKWEEEKLNIKDYYKGIINNNQFEEKLNDYDKIMKVICEKILDINFENDVTTFVIGEYIGDIAYICKNKEKESLFYTKVYYGSCTICDIMQGINVDIELNNYDIAIEKLMSLTLHLIQNLKTII